MQLTYALFLLLSIGNAIPLLFWILSKKRFPTFSKVFIIVIIIFSTLQIGIGVDEIGGFKKERDFQKLKENILQQDSDAERRIFALTLASEGMRKEYDKGFHKKEIEALIVQIRDTALFSTCFADYNVNKRFQDIGNNGLYLSQLSILLSNYYHITEDENVLGVYSKINAFLYIEMREANGGNLQSYGGIAQKWLCDNAGIIYALALYDEELGQYSHEKILPVWLPRLKNDFMDSKTQLPCSQIEGNKDCYEAARGSSSAWLIAYFALLDLPEGKTYWQIFKKEFKVNLLGVGAAFKEYPDYKNTEDYDSGPIIFGLGTYSSGLAIYTAACCQDAFTYLQLKNAFWVVSWAQFLLEEEDLLITALLYNAETKWDN